MSAHVLKYEREGTALTFAIQDIGPEEMRAIIVGLALIVQTKQRRSVGVTAALNEGGTAIAQGILRAYEKGPALTVSAEERRHLLG